MGLSSHVARFLMSKAAAYQFSGNLITLGRQDIFVRKNDIANLELSGLSSLNGDAYPAPEDFFKTLGFDICDSLDYSTNEGATLVQNLNEPLAPGLASRFDFIIDGGTLEHCFNVAEYMKSMVNMLKVGGRVIHINPANNFTNHGLYQFQPTFYYSFYGANHFSDMECFYLEIPRGYADDDMKAPCRVIPVKNYNNLKFHSEHPCQIFFTARKTLASIEVVHPIQEFYYRIFKEKTKVGGGRIENDLYLKIGGHVPENDFERIMSNSYWL
jgi:hypothetical protein